MDCGLATNPRRMAPPRYRISPTNLPEYVVREYRPTATLQDASVRLRERGGGKRTDGHLVVVVELCSGIEAIETPMTRLEMDGEGWLKVLSRVEEVVDMTREVVVSHRRQP